MQRTPCKVSCRGQETSKDVRTNCGDSQKERSAVPPHTFSSFPPVVDSKRYKQERVSERCTTFRENPHSLTFPKLLVSKALRALQEQKGGWVPAVSLLCVDKHETVHLGDTQKLSNTVGCVIRNRNLETTCMYSPYVHFMS